MYKYLSRKRQNYLYFLSSAVFTLKADKEHSIDHWSPSGPGKGLLVWLQSVTTWAGVAACFSSSYFLAGWQYVAALPPAELLPP